MEYIVEVQILVDAPSPDDAWTKVDAIMGEFAPITSACKNLGFVGWEILEDAVRPNVEHNPVGEISPELEAVLRREENV